MTPHPVLNEQGCRLKAEAAARLAEHTKEPSVRAAFEAMARSWTKLAEDLVPRPLPTGARWH